MKTIPFEIPHRITLIWIYLFKSLWGKSSDRFWWITDIRIGSIFDTCIHYTVEFHIDCKCNCLFASNQCIPLSLFLQSIVGLATLVSVTPRPISTLKKLLIIFSAKTKCSFSDSVEMHQRIHVKRALYNTVRCKKSRRRSQCRIKRIKQFRYT